MELIHKLEQKLGGIRLPSGLYDAPELKELSWEALYLYGLLYVAQYTVPHLDEAGRPCVNLVIAEIAEIFRCSKDKAARIRAELLHSGKVTSSKTKSGHTYLYVVFPEQ